MSDKAVRALLAKLLSWEDSHVGLDAAVAGIPEPMRGKRVSGAHSPWELLEHIRITQSDLLEFCRNPEYEEKLAWPQDYWPPTPAPPTADAWEKTISDYRRDREALARFTKETKVDLTEKIPRGTGQTYLRTILVAVDHASYHIGQIVSVRRLLGAWPAG